MTVFGDQTLPTSHNAFSLRSQAAVLRAADVDAGLLAAVTMWLGGDPANLADQSARAVVYDARSRALICVSDEVLIPKGSPLQAVTFPIPGGVYWAGGRLLFGAGGSEPNNTAVWATGNGPLTNRIANPNFEYPGDFDHAWLTSNDVGPSVLVFGNDPANGIPASPDLRGAGARVTMASASGAGTWRPVYSDPADVSNVTVARDVVPTNRLVVRARVVVDTQCVNCGPLRLVLRGMKLVSGTPTLDTEVLVAQTGANLSTYPAGTVIDLAGFVTVPSTATYGSGIGLATAVTSGAHGALRVGKLLSGIEFSAATPWDWFDGNETNPVEELWLGYPGGSRSAPGVLASSPWGAKPPLLLLNGTDVTAPYAFIMTSGEQRTPDLPDEELAAYGWNTAQKMLAGQPMANTNTTASVEWHHTSLDARQGPFALVRTGGPLEELVGDVIRVSRGGRSLFAYVVDASDELDFDLSLARRAFLELADLSMDDVLATVEVTVAATS